MLRKLVISLKSRLDRFPRRYWVCLLVTFTILLMNMIKNIEIITLDRLVITDEQPSTIPYRPGSFTCPYRIRKQQNPNYYKYSQFRWEDDVKRMVAGITLWVHILVHLPFGMLSDLYGGDRVLQWTLAASSLFTLFTPASVEADDRGKYYFAMLTFRRMTAGPLLPACLSLMGRWALPGERMTFVGVFCSGWYVGHTLGRVLAMTTLRWKALYYANAALAALLALLWWAAARAWRAKPTSPPVDAPSRRPRAVRRIPLVELVYSKRLAGLYLFALASHGVSNIVDQVILYYMRMALMSDFRDIMNTSLTLYAPLQLLSLPFPCLAAAIASDRLVAACLVGRPAARRAHAAVGLVGVVAAIALVVAGECEEEIIVAGYSGTDFFNSLQRAVLWNASLDAAPLLAGTLFSLVHAIGTIGVKILSEAVIWYTDSKGIGDLRVWSTVFAVCAALILVLSVPYLVWGPFHEIPWANLDPTPSSIRTPLRYRVFTMATLLLISFVIIVVLIIF